MTPTERRQVETDYRDPIDARLLLTKCAAGLLVIVTIALSGSFAGPADDPLRAALSEPPAAPDR